MKPIPAKEIDLLGEEGGEDLMEVADMGPEPVKAAFSPQQINLEAFQEQWEALDDEVDFCFPKSSIRNDQMF